MANIIIDRDIRDLLDQCEFTDTGIKLPNIQLNRALYVKINKLFESLNGKWNSKLKMHVFDGNPKEKLGLLVDKGVLIDQKKLTQSFYTPQWLVERIVKIANVCGKTVLEPSCGDGRVIDECEKQGAEIILGLDIKDDEIKDRVARKEVIITDFLKFAPESYDVVVGNPPYHKNLWMKHTYHAYDFLKSGGKLVFVLPANPNPKFYKWLSDKDYKVHQIEGPAFKSEGTMIDTCILELNKS